MMKLLRHGLHEHGISNKSALHDTDDSNNDSGFALMNYEHNDETMEQMQPSPVVAEKYDTVKLLNHLNTESDENI